jgi:hypothetical protein
MLAALASGGGESQPEPEPQLSSLSLKTLSGALLAGDRSMATRKTPSRSEPSRTGSTPPSVSDEELARSDEGKLFTDDGRKAHDTERVGAVAPDTDPDSDITAPVYRPQVPPRL